MRGGMTTIALTPKLAIVLVLAACVFLFAGCASIPNAGDAADQRVFLELKHQRQGTDLCVPTSASMILAYYGEERDPQWLQSISTPKGSTFKGAYPVDMVRGMGKLGYRWDLVCYVNDPNGYSNGISRLKWNLRHQRPVMVGFSNPPLGHVVVLVGLDSEKSQLTFLDPDRPYPGLVTMSEERFREAWHEKISPYRCAIFTRPKE